MIEWGEAKLMIPGVSGATPDLNISQGQYLNWNITALNVQKRRAFLSLAGIDSGLEQVHNDTAASA